MSKKFHLSELQRIIIGAVVFAAAFVFDIFTDFSVYISVIPYVVAYLILAIDILKETFESIKEGEIFDENFLMTIASIGAFAIGKFTEAVGVVLFFSIGELFEDYAVGKSRKNIKDLMDIRPDYANVLKDGEVVTVDPATVNVGDIIFVKPGEKVPLDGIIKEGSSSINTAALTGESAPRDVVAGDTVLSGSINNNSVLAVKVTKTFQNSTASKILELVENSEQNKTERENFITRFSKYYTPIVVIAALLLAFVPPLFGASLSEYVNRALIFLVVSCPCALVVSIPLSFFAGIGKASSNGVLIKGSNYLEALANSDTVVFDKTGTLTKGNFKVTEISPVDIPKSKLLELAATAECYSNHPIAVSLREEYGKKIDKSIIGEVNEISGCGVVAKIYGKKVAVGNSKLMKQLSIMVDDDIGTVVHIAIENEYKGHIIIKDEIKPDSERAVKLLKRNGIKRVYMLTGDNKDIGGYVAKEVGITDYFCELLPQQKVEKVEDLKSHGSKVCFVGDGINDAPVLTVADVGIAMGGVGSDAAIEAADIVLMKDQPSRISDAIKISRKTLKIVKQNIVFILAVKFVCLLLGALGLAGLWLAVFADVGTLVLSILNSIRVMKN